MTGIIRVHKFIASTVGSGTCKACGFQWWALVHKR